MIKKHDFNKLSQLDRIEFRQKLNDLRDYYTIFFTHVVFKIWGFLFIVGSLFIGLSFGGSKMLLYMQYFKDSLFGIIFTIVFAIASDMYVIYKKHKAVNHLFKEYFNVETKININKSKNGRKK